MPQLERHQGVQPAVMKLIQVHHQRRGVYLEDVDGAAWLRVPPARISYVAGKDQLRGRRRSFDHRVCGRDARRTDGVQQRADSVSSDVTRRLSYQLGLQQDRQHSPRHAGRLLVTFRVSRRQREMYCGHARLCVFLSVCLSVCPRPHAHTHARTRMQLGGAVGDAP